MKFCQTSLDFIGDIDPSYLLEQNPSEILNPFAIICPHAGYVFSGDVAATIFNTIDPEKEYENIFILSTSHTSNYHGARLFNDIYETPHGNMIINMELNKELTTNCKNLNQLDDYLEDYISKDHTIEVILPFILKKLKPGYKIVPIMLGDYNIDTIKEISNTLKPYINDKNLLIISSDFSHYPNYYDANRIDHETKDLILNNNSNIFLGRIFDNGTKNLVTRMCGWSSYLTLLYMIENEPIDIKVVKYKNSGEALYGGKDRVVGYFGIAFNRK